MKAGQALGLLAGLGALSALRGGRDGTGARFTGLMDMLDGGGAGQSGDRFEGGGLLSMLGNLFAKPIEAQRNVERIAADTAATKALTEALKESVASAETPSVMDETPVGTSNPLVQAIINSRKEQQVMDQPVNQDMYGIGFSDEGEFAGAMPQVDLPRPSVTTAALSPQGLLGPSEVPFKVPMDEQLPPITPAVPSLLDVGLPSAPMLPEETQKYRAMEALRQRFPNATPEQLANAAAMMEM